MDEADQAQEYSEHLLNVEIERCVLAAQSSKLKAQGDTECEECDAAIPEARRLAVPGCRLCITCQTEFEMEKKTFGEHIPKRSVV